MCCIENKMPITRMCIVHLASNNSNIYLVHGAQSNQQPNYIQFIQYEALTNSSKLWIECNRTQFSFRLTFIWKKTNENGKRQRKWKTKIEFLISTNFSFESIRMNNDTCFFFLCLTINNTLVQYINNQHSTFSLHQCILCTNL